MSRSETTRVYVRPEQDQFAKLLWLSNNRPNEMVLGAYGLDGRTATITHEFPERVSSSGDRTPLKFRYEDALCVQLKVDHFTCHQNRFHARELGSNLYSHIEQFDEQLGRMSRPFLRMLVVSDVLGRYRTFQTEPTKPHVWFAVRSEAVLVMRLVFAGVDFPLERAMLLQGRNSASVAVVAGDLKGVVMGRPHQISPESSAARPPGTLLCFSWPHGRDKWKHKAFILG